MLCLSKGRQDKTLSCLRKYFDQKSEKLRESLKHSRTSVDLQVVRLEIYDPILIGQSLNLDVGSCLTLVITVGG